jgi:hypothetical protein
MRLDIVMAGQRARNRPLNGAPPDGMFSLDLQGLLDGGRGNASELAGDGCAPAHTVLIGAQQRLVTSEWGHLGLEIFIDVPRCHSLHPPLCIGWGTEAR